METDPALQKQPPPAEAEKLYEYMLNRCRESASVVEHGVFGAEMKVELCNDGPFTIILDENTFA